MFTLLMQRDYFITAISPSERTVIEQAASEDYQSIYFKEKKIGYVASSSEPIEEGKIRLRQDGFMRLNVAGTHQTITLHLDAVTAEDNLLKQFSFSFRSPFYRMDADGTVEGNRVTYQLKTTSSIIKDSLTFSNPPRIPSANRRYLLSENLEVGEKRKIPWFDPVSMTGKDSVIEYRGQDSQLIGGRVLKLHKFLESFSGARVNFWLSDNGSVVKEESPAGFVFIREPKFRALAMSDQSEELLSAVSVRVKGSIPSGNTALARYRLFIPPDAELDLNSDRQHFSGDILTIQRETLPAETQQPNCRDQEASLAATPYVQVNAPEFTALINELIVDSDTPFEKTQKIARWVYENLDKRSVIGLPDALTTFKSRQGDCNEHASLFAALARTAGIPTNILAGVTANNGAFYYHAWNEVCLGERWISVDTTTNQIPADLTHIQFIRGDIKEQIRISSLLGNLTIEPLQDKPFQEKISGTDNDG